MVFADSGNNRYVTNGKAGRNDEERKGRKRGRKGESDIDLPFLTKGSFQQLLVQGTKVTKTQCGTKLRSTGLLQLQ
jgi:hypothetical protein